MPGRWTNWCCCRCIPQYSYATTLSSMKEWRRVYGTAKAELPERAVNSFHDHPLYIQAVVQRIGSVLRQFPDSSRIHLVFSAHGLPMSLVEKGDPYPKQIEETVRLVCEAGARQYPGWPKTHLLCYQSRVGPAKWLQPPFTGTIERLGHEGVKEMLVVPISFVTEHIETLHEINIEGRAGRQEIGHRDVSHDAGGGGFAIFYCRAEGFGVARRGSRSGGSCAYRLHR